jgi:hypothetical protein
LIGIGGWEANVMSDNSDAENNSNYIVGTLIITKSVMNILIGIIITMYGYFFKDSDDIISGIINILFSFNFAIGIWSIGMYYSNIDVIKQFDQVLYIECVLTYIYMLFFVCFIIFSCCIN